MYSILFDSGVLESRLDRCDSLLCSNISRDVGAIVNRAAENQNPEAALFKTLQHYAYFHLAGAGQTYNVYQIEDGVIIHALGGTPVTIGKRTALAHGCIIHGPCTIGEGCFIGFRAVVFKSVLGNGSFIGANATVQGVDLAANSLAGPAEAVLSDKHAAKLAGKAGNTEHAFVEKVINENLKLTKGYNSLE